MSEKFCADQTPQGKNIFSGCRTVYISSFVLLSEVRQAYDPNVTKEAQPAARGCVPSIDRLEYVDCSLFVSCSNKLVADNGKGVQK